MKALKEALKIAVKRVQELTKKTDSLREQLKNVDPTTTFRDAAGNLVNRQVSLEQQLAEAAADLIAEKAKEAALRASIGAGGEAAAGQTASWAARARQALGRAARGTGRSIINAARWVAGKPPIPPVSAGLGATLAGGAAMLAGAALVTYAAANAAGWLASDSAVQPGVRMDGIASTAVPPPVSINEFEKYGVYLLPDVSGGSIIVSQEGTLQNSLTCNISGGGLCVGDGTDSQLRYELKSALFDSYDDAVAAFCSAAGEIVYSQIASSYKALGTYGGDYWLVAGYNCAA